MQRLRFEHPEVRAVVLTGGTPKVFCAGANIQMLAGSTHHHKVNFCKFTNETRMAIEDATRELPPGVAGRGQRYGGGRRLRVGAGMRRDHPGRRPAPRLSRFPRSPFWGVLPGTGGLTRLVDKRHVRRDLADVFATRAEGVKGKQAVEWGLVDAVAPPLRTTTLCRLAPCDRAAGSDRPDRVTGLVLTPLERVVSGDRGSRTPTFGWISTVTLGSLASRYVGQAARSPADTDELDSACRLVAAVAGSSTMPSCWLRFNEPEIGTWVLRSRGRHVRRVRPRTLLATAPITGW